MTDLTDFTQDELDCSWMEKQKRDQEEMELHAERLFMDMRRRGFAPVDITLLRYLTGLPESKEPEQPKDYASGGTD